jgi:hypothetical protein
MDRSAVREQVGRVAAEMAQDHAGPRVVVDPQVVEVRGPRAPRCASRAPSSSSALPRHKPCVQFIRQEAILVFDEIMAQAAEIATLRAAGSDEDRRDTAADELLAAVRLAGDGDGRGSSSRPQAPQDDDVHLAVRLLGLGGARLGVVGDTTTAPPPSDAARAAADADRRAAISGLLAHAHEHREE